MIELFDLNTNQKHMEQASPRRDQYLIGGFVCVWPPNLKFCIRVVCPMTSQIHPCPMNIVMSSFPQEQPATSDRRLQSF